MSLPETMSGVQLTGHGGPETLLWRDDLPVPCPRAGQVLVRVLAAGVNNTDINTRIGWYAPEVTGATDAVDRDVEAGGWCGALDFPRIQGGDLCGTVMACGPNVEEVGEGMRVTCPINLARPTPENPFGYIALGSEIDGAFAQFCVVNAADLFDVTESPLSDIEIAAMPCAYGTAWNLLNRASVVAGQRVLITGASGGVGLAAVQLATYLGAEVVAVASPAKQVTVKDAGARDVLGRTDIPAEHSVDRVIDVVGGPAWPALIRALKPGGHYAVSGAIAGPIVEADLRQIYLPDITIHGCTFTPRQVFASLVDLIRQGAIRPLIARTFPLRRIAEAQEAFLSKMHPGKIVLLPWESTNA